MCCSVLQCVALCCSVLHYAAVRCSVADKHNEGTHHVIGAGAHPNDDDGDLVFIRCVVGKEDVD